MTRALTSASNAHRREACPGSARMEDGLPDIKTKESEQGDRLHDFSAHPEYERQLLSPEEQDLLRTADQLEAQAFDAIGLLGEYEETREVELGDELIGGHPDLLRIYHHSKISVITDRKFGWAPVDRAEVNLQLRVYAVLAPTPDVYVGILQPRATRENRVTVARYNIDSKAAARKQIAAIMEACEDPDAPLVAGEHCRYCRARMICPALKEAVTKEMVIFDELPPDLSKRAMTSRIEARLSTASDSQLDALYKACKLAGLVEEPLGDEIRRRIAAGQMTDYTLGEESEVRGIDNVRRAISLIVLRRLLTREQLLGICSLGLGNVETLYRKESKTSAKEAKAEINRTLESVIKTETRKGRILRK